ncbi:MAG: hypothetical protein K6A63_02050 [Acholeplasmatales bacterium]|nr:hypothetical protein [Acholeplasmatales bacterium]
MASLSEILNLNKTKATINKIDLFLGVSEKYSYEFIAALCFKGEVMESLGDINGALKLVYEYVPYFNKMENRSVITICNFIINFCIKYEKYDQAIKYIEVKKGYLPVSNLSIYLKDKIVLALKMKDYPKAREILEKYLEDDLTKEETIYAKENLAGIYFNERNFKKYLEILPGIEAYYKENLMLDKLCVTSFNHLYIDYIDERYTKVIFDGKDFLKTNKDNVLYSLKATTIMIKSFVACNNLKQASIMVSNFEDVAGENYLDDSIDFFYAAKEVYSRLGNASAIIEYNAKLEKLNKVKNPIKEAPKPKKVVVEEKEPVVRYDDIVIPTIEFPKAVEEEVKEVSYRHDVLNPKPKEEIIQTQEIVKKIDSKKTIEVSKEFKHIEKVFNAINSRNLDSKFRELFRLACIELCKAFPIDEVYVLYEKKVFNGIHFKKGRAYDKKCEVDDIERTINYTAFIQDTEIFLDDTDKTYNHDIVNNIDYEDDMFGFAMPLHNEVGVIGSIAYFAKEQFLADGFCYEALKLLTSVINTRLLVFLKQEKLENDNDRAFFLINNMNSGIKEECDGYIHFNEAAQNILGVLQDVTMDDFLFNMDSKYLPDYKTLLEEIYKNLTLGKSIEYEYKKDDSKVFVKESFYPKMKDGNLWVTSLIEDITDTKAREAEIIKDAYINPISGMYTEIKLMVDLRKNISEEHMALAVFEVQDFSIYTELYGYNLPAQIIKAIGIYLKGALENDFKVNAYHLERDRFAIIFKTINDKRVLDKKLNEIFDSISKEVNKLSNRINLLFNSGVFRVLKGSGINDENVILANALDALNDSYIITDDGHHIAHFSSEMNKQRFKDAAKVNAISEALDTNQIGLYYQQMVNLDDKSLFGYYIVPSHDSYEIEYELLEKIAIRKNLIRKLDRYVISNVLREERILRTETKFRMTMFLYIHKESLDLGLADFIKRQLNLFKTNPSQLVLIVDSVDKASCALIKGLNVRIATRNPFDLYNYRLDYLIYDYHKASYDSIEDMYKLALKFDSSIILEEINTNDDIKYCVDNHYNLVYGKKYKTLRRLKEIIGGIKHE